MVLGVGAWDCDEGWDAWLALAVAAFAVMVVLVMGWFGLGWTGQGKSAMSL